MHKIDVDDEVFAFLQREAEPFVDTPNDVLRRRLLQGAAQPHQPRAKRRKGPLASLIEAGYVSPGDRLVHRQKRKGNVHHGEILEDGWVRANGKDYDSLSPSLGESVGHQINGWLWVHERSGSRLYDMRERLNEH
ncbi:hypothetical protein ACFPJ1_27495 [Kribbella qitaiheensis]|uniref:restriction system modified-DNA reader domain-containing protein n=1 Tax=Kribbella qitaiheensis TaxID=1544730 RepID=UPI00361B68E7